MAIDTSDKRFSMLNFADAALLPEPDSEIVGGDRLHFLALYSGVEAGAVAAAVALGRGGSKEYGGECRGDYKENTCS